MPNAREKLIELLTQVAVLGDYLDMQKVADHLIANGVTVQEWISVKDRLPEGECLAVSMQKGHSYKEMLVGYVYADAYSDTLYTAESDGEVLRNVTHWMPLPEPPKGE
jgi:hypothetical protein